ncbi:xylulokinase [Breoghania corrubedonensis]|uniref:Xylulose kinase n=1 Tax=Breoghania corrubedonensis TaxID=665038 RepID=A0A2T5UU46_9HYPH|nr:xylulokinase [Breoghania corrubedonensis]PTW55049.1 xylulokinase [Breoghania corrubedonensis]
MFLGLDLGTSGLKGLIIRDDQSVVASATAPLEISRPKSGWSEQDPQDWVDALVAVLDVLRTQISFDRISGIGLSGQMHGATPLDHAGNVLRPSILWNDTRAEAEAGRMDKDPVWRSVSGNIVFPGFTAPKLAWMKAHEPHLFEATRMVLLPKDYLRFWLTGEFVSEMSDAAGTSWLDTGKRDWSDVLLGACGMDRSQMPRLVEGSEASACLKADIAARWGFAKDAVVAGGAGDNAASAVGAGLTKAGEGFVSLGTSGVVFVANDAYAPAPETAVHTFCHALPDRWHQMGVVLSASDALAWFARLLEADPSVLASTLGDLSAPGRALFLPYLGGERTPINNASVRAAFLGLEHSSDRTTTTRAVLEGVAFALRDSLEAIRETGTDVTSLVAIGGGSRSDYWLQVLACVLRIPIDVPAGGEYGAALGCARLGMMAATGAGADIATRPKIARTIEPVAELGSAFEAGYARYAQAREMLAALS